METKPEIANRNVSGMSKIDANLDAAMRMTGEIASTLVKLVCPQGQRLGKTPRPRVSVIPSYDHVLQVK